MEFDLPSQTSPSVLVWCSDRNPPILEMHVLTSCLELHLNKDIHFCIHMANRKHNIYKDEHSSNKSTHLPVVYVLNTFENLWHMATLYHNTLSHWPIDHRGSVNAKERMLIYISRSKYCMQESTLRIFYIILISDITLQWRSTMNWLYFYWRVHN